MLGKQNDMNKSIETTLSAHTSSPVDTNFPWKHGSPDSNPVEDPNTAIPADFFRTRFSRRLTIMSKDSSSSPPRDDRKGPNTPSYTSLASAGSSQDVDPLEEQVLERIKGDSFIVDWYGVEDKGNPQNLPLWRKWLVTMSVALYVLTTTFASSVFSAAAVVTAKEFKVAVETMVSLERKPERNGGERTRFANAFFAVSVGPGGHFNVYGRICDWPYRIWVYVTCV